MSQIDDGFQFPRQLFPTDSRIAPNAVWLAFYSIATLVAILRLQYSQVLGLLIILILILIVTFALRVHQANEDDVSITQFRAMIGLLAVAFPVLCQCVLTLVGEHFNTAATVYERKHRLFVHLLSLLLVADVAIGIYYAVVVGENSLNTTIQVSDHTNLSSNMLKPPSGIHRPPICLPGTVATPSAIPVSCFIPHHDRFLGIPGECRR